ncbi:MAG: 3-hydroxybutyrate dehydrogenase [Actinobacteria bacterium]|nr:3-hydroxybutyrate dehydrogenase [Actinomycetota bacterium]
MSRVAVVTGAASGIGAAIATHLAAEGWDVFGVDLEQSRLEVEGIGADLTERAGNQAAITAAVERFGRIDAVIANAGFQHVAPITEMPEDKWDAIIALLLTSPFLLAKYAWPHLVESGQGRFVVIASAHALSASPFKAPYVSAKHGVLGLVKTLAIEGAPDGITANAICPAYVRTPLVEAQIADQARVHGIPEDRVLEEVILARQPIKRLIEPAEVAATVSFLLGPNGASFSGAPVTMDQGWTAS